MGQTFKYKTDDVNQELFANYFSLNEFNKANIIYLINNFSENNEELFNEFNINLMNKNRMVFIGSGEEDKELFKSLKNNFRKFKIVEYIYLSKKISRYAAIQNLESSDIIFILGNANEEFVSEYELGGILERYKGIIIAEGNSINLLKNLSLINLNINVNYKQRNELDGIGLTSDSFIKIDKYGDIKYFGQYFIKENDQIVKKQGN